MCMLSAMPPSRAECDELREWRLCCTNQEREARAGSNEAGKKPVAAKADVVRCPPHEVVGFRVRKCGTSSVWKRPKCP